MAIRIGDMLIKAGIINNDQLDKALKQQVIFGGKLGTNLIEMDFIDEEALAFFLGEKLGVPYAHLSRFENVPQKVLDIIPRKIAEKHGVFPLEVDKRRLHLAMTDPTDMAAIDEISFQVNMQIKPIIAPELRLVIALERFYDIPKGLRYISLINKQSTKVSAETTADDVKTIANSVALDKDPRAEFFENALKHETGGEEEEDEILDDLEFLPVEEEVDPDIEGARPVTINEEIINKYTVDAFSRDLSQSENREEVADCLLSYVNQKFSTASIFVIWDKSILGWKASGQPEFVEAVNSLKIPLDRHIPFKRVYQQKQSYLGPGSNSPLAYVLKSINSECELIMPIIMTNEVVSFLYVCGPQEELKEALNEYDGITTKASLAFEMLIIKSKILMT